MAKATTDYALDFNVSAKALRSALTVVSATMDKNKAAAGHSLYLRGSNKNNKQQLVLFTTDGSQESMTSLPAEVSTPGSLLVSPDLLVPVLATLGEESKIRFSMKTGAPRVQVTSGTVKINVPMLDKKWHEDSLQSMPFGAKPAISLPAFKLRAVIERTTRFIYKKEDQYVLQNIHMLTKDRQLQAYAFDRFVAARASINGLLEEQNGFDLLLHSTFVDVFRRMLARIKDDSEESVNVDIILAKNGGASDRVYVRTPDMFYGTVTGTGNYPDFSSKSPTIVDTLVINRQALVLCLKRIEPFCEGIGRPNKGIKLLAFENNLRVEGKNGTVEFQEEIPLKEPFAGPSQLFVSFENFRNVVESAQNEDVRFSFTKEKTVVVVDSGSYESGQSNYMVATAREE